MFLYEIGDVVVFGGKWYRCVVAVESAEDFDVSKWVEINLIDNGLIILEEEEVEE